MLVFQVMLEAAKKQDKSFLSGIVPKKMAAKLEKEGDSAMKDGGYDLASKLYGQAALIADKDGARRLWSKKADALIALADSMKGTYTTKAEYAQVIGLYEEAQKHSPRRKGEIDAKIAEAYLVGAEYYLRGGLLGGNIEMGAEYFEKACGKINEAKESAKWDSQKEKVNALARFVSHADRIFNEMKTNANLPENKGIFNPKNEEDATEYKAYLLIHLARDSIDW